jgi:secreted PhoX family phosphatase
VLGTLNNCASGITPWGTYLTCEENFIFYFKGPEQPDAHQARWGLRKGDPVGYRWHEHDERFDASRHPHEINRFGWVVEIDPFNPSSVPVKRTALGRAAHEGATVATTATDAPWSTWARTRASSTSTSSSAATASARWRQAANAELLDHGTLYVARFDADGRGRWMPLVQGQGPADRSRMALPIPGELLIKTRQASDLLGATKMDRPEWIDIDKQGWVYCTLTNNSNRGGTCRLWTPPTRAPTTPMGHIIRWKEDGDHDGLRFQWNHFVLAGDPFNERAEAKGNVKGDPFACPDGLWVDGAWRAVDPDRHVHFRRWARAIWPHGQQHDAGRRPAHGEVRRFLVGPVGCEITGATATPDGRTMFINIQHPGEAPASAATRASRAASATGPTIAPTADRAVQRSRFARTTAGPPGAFSPHAPGPDPAAA